MELLGGELIRIAKENSVPAGNALAIAREDFSKAVTKEIENNSDTVVVHDNNEDIEMDLPDLKQ